MTAATAATVTKADGADPTRTRRTRQRRWARGGGRTAAAGAVVLALTAGAVAAGPAAPAATRAAAFAGSRAGAAVPARSYPSYSAAARSGADGADGADRTAAARLAVRFPRSGLGAGAVGAVLDADSGRTVWAGRADRAVMPASSAKLALATTALTVLGANRTERTRVLYRTGTVYLVGGADPLLTRGALAALAARAGAALRARGVRTVRVRVDDSLFPAPAMSPGWRRDYYPGEVSPLRALAVHGSPSTDTALAAGRAFAGALAGHGVGRVGKVRRSRAAAGSATLAAHTSPPLSTAIRSMLQHSDNWIAEDLLRLTALAAHRPATWRGGTRTEWSVLARYGVPLAGVRLYDGSGLSREDRFTARALAAIAALAVAPAHARVLGPLLAGLPVAARSGTLAASYRRFTTRPSSCAAGRVHAKTGSMTGVAALAGLTRGRDGRWKAFAFVENGRDETAAVKRGLDDLAATVTGCW